MDERCQSQFYNGVDEQTSKTPRVVIVGGGFVVWLRPKPLGKRRPKSFSLTEQTIMFFSRFFTGSDLGTRAVANEFANPRSIAKNKKYNGDHGRGYRVDKAQRCVL